MMGSEESRLSYLAFLQIHSCRAIVFDFRVVFIISNVGMEGCYIYCLVR